MDEMRALKAHHNTVSFAEIEKNEFRHKKELSLPPISQVVRDLQINDSPLKKNALNLLTPLQKLAASSNVSQTALSSPGRHGEVIDEIHRLRVAAYDKNEQDKGAVKHIKIQISKREKDDILSKYFSAKKQLNNISAR
jgi:hypothetical protein